MKIQTSVPILKEPTSFAPKIAQFWNKISEGWRDIWGLHIHHGYYENAHESLCPIKAQEKLIEKLAEYLDLKSNQKVLDVGCGMGGSSLFLAQTYQVMVTGISLSQKQIDIARQELNQLQNSINSKITVEFKIEDAHHLKQFEDNQFDIVWSLESCEQFYNKQQFINEAYRVLRPGGKLMLATWCSDQEQYENEPAKNYLKICKAFDLPYMPTISFYKGLLEKHFEIEAVLDWSLYVKSTWNNVFSELKKYPIWLLFKKGGILGLKFIYQIRYLRKAFDLGTMRYGVFIVKKKK